MRNLRLLAIGIIASLMAASEVRAQSILQFDGNLATQSGPGSLTFRGNASTVSTFNTTTGFGIAPLPGGTATVMSFPAYDQTQGMLFAAGVGPNGGGAYLNRYTFGFDMLLPSINYMALYQTDFANSNGNDADFYVDPTGAIGTIGSYHGAVAANTWNRIMVSVDAPTQTMKKYINGALVGSTTLNSGLDGRWALYSSADPPGTGTVIFSEGDTSGIYTVPGYINSLFFEERVLSDSEILSLGGATAAGFAPIPEPGTLLLTGLGAAALTKWRRRRVPA